jgi:hypothetical protein
MGKIKLKYNQGRRGIWSVAPIKVKDIPKDIDFDWKIMNVEDDYRRVVGRLLASKEYKRFAIYNEDMKDTDFLIGWVFKASVLGSDQVFYIRLQNSLRNPNRGHFAATGGFRTKSSLYKTITDVLIPTIKRMLREDLRYVKVKEFLVTYNAEDGEGECGMGISRMPRTGELVMGIVRGGRNSTDARVGDTWRI